MFVSGKSTEYAWDRPKISEALSEEQRRILQRRGVLTPAELERLASKTRERMGATEGKAICHSDLADDEVAERVQAEKLGEDAPVEPLQAP